MKPLTITYSVTVKVEARDEPVTRGRWLKPIEIARDADWQQYEAPPLTNQQLVSEVRQRLNEMWKGTGVSSSDFHFTVDRITNGKVTRA